MKKFIVKLLTCLLLCCCSLYNIAQNFIDKYLSDPLVYTTIGTSANGLNQPKDLDFKPNSNELWVGNYGTSQGGSMVIFYNAGQPNQSVQYRKDSHSGHFMIYTSAIAFSDIGEWGCTSEIKSTASANSTFMGPGLWSADTNIFAKVFQNNWASGFPLGSHIDMLHQSPFSMGLAHESAKIYWVFDGWNSNLCKYDFVTDHGAGYDNHSAGKIWRHTDIALTRVPGIPSHMVMDKTSKWLYIVNGGPKQLIRVNTNTGTVGGNLSVPNTAGEPLALYKSVTGATKETLDTYTSQPCGIDYSNDRLIVGDYTTGDIRIYNTAAATPSLMGTIVTGQPGIMGLKIGYDGKIWFVNKTLNTVVRIDPQPVTNDALIKEIVYPKVENFIADFHSPYFNDCGSTVIPIVNLQNNGTGALTSVTVNYKIDGGTINTFNWTGNLASGLTTTVSLPLVIVNDGTHEIEAYTTNPNGSPDLNPLNDKTRGAFRSRENAMSLPFLEDFSGTTFPPTGWSYMGFNKFCPMSREASLGAFGSNDGCLKMDNTSGAVDITGQTDYFLSPRLDFGTTGPGTNLEFDVAYAQYNSSSNDKLDVRISTDCGESWTSVYNQAGSALSTAAPVTSVFYPQPTEWRTELVSLDAYIGQEVMVLFTATSNFGNNLYIDNIKINYVTTVGLVKSNLQDNVTVFPNPTNGKLCVDIQSESINEMEVFDILGIKVVDMKGRTSTTTSGKIVMDLTGQAPGTYFLKLTTADNMVVRKIIIE